MGRKEKDKKIPLSRGQIRNLVYRNMHPDLGLNSIQFETDLKKLFR